MLISIGMFLVTQSLSINREFNSSPMHRRRLMMLLFTDQLGLILFSSTNHDYLQ